MVIAAVPLVGILAALAPPPGGAPTAPPLIIVMPVKLAMANGDRIGARRTGKFCLPAGSIRWADVALSATAAQAAVVRGLKAGAFAAFTSDDAGSLPTATYRVEASITSATLDACVAQRGILLAAGGRRSTKLSGRLSIRWTIIGMGGDTSARQVTTVARLNADGADLVLQTEVETAITAGAVELATRLRQSTDEAR